MPVLDNSQMRAGRYLRWHDARRKLRDILAHLTAGGAVLTFTYTRATRYTARHAAMFRAARSGLYVRRGNSWECIDFTPIRFV